MFNFDNIEEKDFVHFRNGEGIFKGRLFSDEHTKIMKGRLQKGVSIGYHCHDTNCEIVYVLSGTATCVLDGQTMEVHPGEVHYCPKGHSHSMTNTHDEELVVFCVIPELK